MTASLSSSKLSVLLTGLALSAVVRDARFITPLGARYAPVTVRQLQSHTSGLARGDDQLLAGVLGAIIERLTGQHWDEMLEREFFRPLEMGRMVGTFSGHHTIFHPGGKGSGARSFVAYFPDGSLAIVLLANAEPVDLDRVEAAITAAWYGAAEPAGSH